MPTLAVIAREACITDPVLLWAIISGNALIFVAYMWIPISVIRVLRSHTVPLPLIWLLGGSFVLCCGFTHAIGVLVIFRAYYGLEAGLLIMTAAVSLLAAWVLHRGVPLIRQHLVDYQALQSRVRDLQHDLDRRLADSATAIPIPSPTSLPPSPAPAPPSSPSSRG